MFLPIATLRIVLSLLLSVWQELVLKYLTNTVCKQKITLVLKYDIGGYDILRKEILPGKRIPR